MGPRLDAALLHDSVDREGRSSKPYPEEVERFSTLVDIPPGAIELDYLIADPARRGRGPGTRLSRRRWPEPGSITLARLPYSSGRAR
jgi:hypothetical protein